MKRASAGPSQENTEASEHIDAPETKTQLVVADPQVPKTHQREKSARVLEWEFLQVARFMFREVFIPFLISLEAEIAQESIEKTNKTLDIILTVPQNTKISPLKQQLLQHRNNYHLLMINAAWYNNPENNFAIWKGLISCAEVLGDEIINVISPPKKTRHLFEQTLDMNAPKMARAILRNHYEYIQLNAEDIWFYVVESDNVASYELLLKLYGQTWTSPMHMRKIMSDPLAFIYHFKAMVAAKAYKILHRLAHKWVDILCQEPYWFYRMSILEACMHESKLLFRIFRRLFIAFESKSQFCGRNLEYFVQKIDNAARAKTLKYFYKFLKPICDQRIENEKMLQQAAFLKISS